MAMETFAGPEEFENERSLKICASPLWQNGIQECSRFTDSEATKTYCEEMKKT